MSLLLSSVLILPSFAMKDALISERRVVTSLEILVSRIESSSPILVLISFLILVISAVIDVLIFILRVESSSEIFCLRIIHMLTIPMNMVEITSKKIADSAKNDMLPEELNDIKLDMFK